VVTLFTKQRNQTWSAGCAQPHWIPMVEFLLPTFIFNMKMFAKNNQIKSIL